MREERGIAVDVEPAACSVDADPAKLHDVIRNLVENAINYSPEGAAIRLEAARRNGAVDIIVSDSGPGIPPTDLTRVFTLLVGRYRAPLVLTGVVDP